MTKIKSDGGSSEYYKITMPKSVLRDNGDGTVTFETGDVIRYALGNDFNLGNVLKALVRFGKKDGIDYDYDRNKINYFLDDHIRAKSIEKKEVPVPDAEGWLPNPGYMPVDGDVYVSVVTHFRTFDKTLAKNCFWSKDDPRLHDSNFMTLKWKVYNGV